MSRPLFVKTDINTNKQVNLAFIKIDDVTWKTIKSIGPKLDTGWNLSLIGECEHVSKYIIDGSTTNPCIEVTWYEYKCDDCGSTFREYFDPVGHTPDGNYFYDDNYDNGIHYQSCSRCGQICGEELHQYSYSQSSPYDGTHYVNCTICGKYRSEPCDFVTSDTWEDVFYCPQCHFVSGETGCPCVCHTGGEAGKDFTVSCSDIGYELHNPTCDLCGCTYGSYRDGNCPFH